MIPFHRLDVPATPVGPLILIASERGLWHLHFGGDPGGDPKDHREGDRSHPILGPAAQALEAYFGGASDPFHDLPLDLHGRTSFQLQVLRALQRIPRGSVRSYGDLAEELGRGSPRAVGQAVGANPIPIVIPCHRVVARDRRLGGFSGGLDRKVLLLEREGVQVEGHVFRSRIRIESDREPGPRKGSVSARASG
ncbi:MAG: methylated-DNA--[protein]-cysteine S-methyltransferase [Gemmatimonadales bacterium]|nr:MAG: methylated-DNA--[protein]-cysteine S-methyltransferase [Gemmatimonadales bacterium]